MQMKKKKRIALLDWDMTVTGGAEAVAASLTRAFGDIYDVYFVTVFQKNSELAYDLSAAKKVFCLDAENTRPSIFKAASPYPDFCYSIT